MTEPDSVGEARGGEPLGIVLAIVAALVAGAGCVHATDPRIIEDAQIAVRVKTVLVNDAALGTRAIEVRVIRGVAHLSGIVTSDEESARAVALGGRLSTQVEDGRFELTVAIPRTATPLPSVPL